MRAITTAVVVLVCSGIAAARCGDQPGDQQAVATVRGDAAMQCDCDTAASHSAYVGCVAGVAASKVDDGTLPADCRGAVIRCASRSTCGRPGAFVCLKTTAAGRSRCGIRRSTGVCRPPSGGSACVSVAESCCDASCTAPTTTSTTLEASTTSTTVETSTTLATTTSVVTTTSTSSTTSSTIWICTDPVYHGTALARLPVTIAPGTADCGGPALSPPPAAPFAGEIDDGSATKLSDLGAGCLYLGGGRNVALQNGRIPDGGQAVLNVVGAQGLALVLGPGAGNSSRDCTQGAGPGLHCIDGGPGTDGHGACSADADCTGVGGSCALDANCFFGPPLPLPDPSGVLSTCIVNVVQQDACGQADLTAMTSTLNATLSARIFLTGNTDSACPRCVGGICDSGPRAGDPCQAVGSLATSLDCPPEPGTYLGAATAYISPLTTETATLTSDANGIFCPQQRPSGAFGHRAARTITTHGSRLSIDLLNNRASLMLAAPFCAPRTRSGLIDGSADLPGPGAVSVPATFDLTDVLLGGLLP